MERRNRRVVNHLNLVHPFESVSEPHTQHVTLELVAPSVQDIDGVSFKDDIIAPLKRGELPNSKLTTRTVASLAGISAADAQLVSLQDAWVFWSEMADFFGPPETSTT